MAADAPRSLLERRIVIVTGKGGTGKTTVAAALAVAAARAGKRVLVAEMAHDEALRGEIWPRRHQVEATQQAFEVEFGSPHKGIADLQRYEDAEGNPPAKWKRSAPGAYYLADIADEDLDRLVGRTAAAVRALARAEPDASASGPWIASASSVSAYAAW